MNVFEALKVLGHYAETKDAVEASEVVAKALGYEWKNGQWWPL